MSTEDRWVYTRKVKLQILMFMGSIEFHLFSFLSQKLRGELDKLLNRKIEEPGFDISTEGKGVVAAAVELLHSQVHH